MGFDYVLANVILDRTRELRHRGRGITGVAPPAPREPRLAGAREDDRDACRRAAVRRVEQDHEATSHERSTSRLSLGGLADDVRVEMA